MVKLSVRMVGWGWKYHLDFYLQQKKNSSIFSKKNFANCCNYTVKESEIKRNKPNLFFHLSYQLSDGWKFSKVNSLAIYNAFSLINTPLTETFSGSWPFKPFEHGFVDLITGINFHPFRCSTPLLKKLKDFILIIFSYGKCLMVIMASLLVRNVETFELQRESYQRDLEIRSNYRNFWITEIRITERRL